MPEREDVIVASAITDTFALRDNEISAMVTVEFGTSFTIHSTLSAHSHVKYGTMAIFSGILVTYRVKKACANCLR